MTSTPAAALRVAADAVWRRRYPLLAAAVLVAGVTALVSATTPPLYRAGTVHQVAVSGPPGSGDPTAAIAEVIDLAAAPGFRAVAAQRAGTTPQRLADEIEVTDAGSGTVRVTATDPDPHAARSLAGATGQALASALAERGHIDTTTGAALLQTEMTRIATSLDQAKLGMGERLAAQQRLDALARSEAEILSAPRPYLVPGPPPVVDPNPVSPNPLRDASITFVVTLVVLAAAVPTLRAARGRLAETGSAADLGQRLGVPAVELQPRTSPTPALAELHRNHLRRLSSYTAVQLSGTRACDIGAELVKAAELAGDPRTHHDRAAAGPTSDEPSVSGIRLDGHDEQAVRALRGVGPTVLVVETATARRDHLDRWTSGLRAVGAPPVAVIVFCGRIPRDPLREPEPTAGPDRL